MAQTRRASTSILSRAVLKVLNRLVVALSAPIILSEYFHAETGKDYGVRFWTKLKLAVRMARNSKKVITGSHFLEHLLMATQILNVPADVEGCVVECGTFKGGSATNLSVVCALCHRQLEIFDSFRGLPEPKGTDREHLLVSLNEVHTYAKGAWQGTLEEVKRNISRHGAIDVCNFNVGYFNETLPTFKSNCVLAFLDVDLTDSLETCLKYLWPLMRDGGHIFTHEAAHREIAAAFFDQEWWHSNLHCDPPGLVGAGNGLGLLPANGGFRSDLGFTVKNPQVLGLRVNPQTGRRDAEVHSTSV
jgi:hypothetical protein